MPGELVVRDNPERSRFELVEAEEVIGFAEYRIADDKIVMTHTEIIDPARRNAGLGEVLVGTAVAQATIRGLRIVPTCSFVADYLERHPEATAV